MGTIVARQRKDGSVGYMVRLRIMRDGATYHETEIFDRQPAAAVWMKRREGELAKSGATGRTKADDPTLGNAIDRGEEFVVPLVVAGGDSSEVFELVEEALDSVALTINPGAERKGFDPVGHGADIGPWVAFGHLSAQRIAGTSPVGEQDITRLDRVQHVSGRAAVVSPAFGQLQPDRATLGINKGDAGRMRTAARWNISARRPGAQPSEDAVQNAPVNQPRNATHLHGQKRSIIGYSKSVRSKRAISTSKVEINETECQTIENLVHGYVT